MGAEYRNNVLARCPELIGHKIHLSINPDDISSIMAYSEDGKELGFLTATGEWGTRSHSLKTREWVNRLAAENKSSGKKIYTPLSDLHQELLLAVGHPEFEKGTTTVLKNRLLNSLLASASVTKSKKVVLFIDEAQNMSVNDFEWLMDIYNNLSLWDIHMVSFLFGSLELRQHQKKTYIFRNGVVV